ncbi:hypothetical protein [Synechococcus sp. CC9616]
MPPTHQQQKCNQRLDELSAAADSRVPDGLKQGRQERLDLA